MSALTVEQALALAHERLRVGQLAAVESICQAILQAYPRVAEAYRLLGIVAHQTNNVAAAVQLLRQAVALAPAVAVYRDNLSFLLMAHKQVAEAEAEARAALALDPTSANACHNLGVALEAQERYAEAEAAYRKALELNPSLADSAYSLGNVLMAQDRLAESEAAFRQALQLRPDHADAANNLGIVLASQGRLTEAEMAYRQARDLRPGGSADAENNLGMALHAQGRLEEALAAYRRALRLRPHYATAHSNAVYTEQFRTGVSLARLGRVHAEWCRCQAETLFADRRPLAIDPDPDRRLRLGFISADFRRHPVGFFLIRTLEALDRSDFDVVCYCDRAVDDDLGRRFRATADTWRPTHRLTARELADLVRADRIDILFDLAGHLANNRLLTFALRPAPLQVTWIGYMGTTGLKTMDYILADRYHIAEGEECYYVERVLRLPEAFFCYDPPAEAPEPGPLPALRQGHVTFGSFNTPAKLTPQVVAVWADVLRRLPGSRLVLKFRGLDDPGVRQRFHNLFECVGIDRSRIGLKGWSPRPDHLRAYHGIDLALDPFPFSGSTTTLEALWMGVPVLTCPGTTFAGRHSYSYLSNLGLTELIANDLADYVNRAVALAGDLDRLSAWRRELRRRVAESPLCDAPRFARNLGGILRGIWRQWCASGPMPSPHPGDQSSSR
ncbi:MAG: tetratricopeptide repeat protein [Gemmataceae bacterium]|nr:tetratricopeptide repeat protein [Gemmataceae bacterium]MDW8265735.1 tetratricopeptide repeat protein [Gemmataceae bacterium]